MGFPGGSEVKNLPANAGDAEGLSSIPGVSAGAFSSGWTHRLELLDHMVILFLIFSGTTILFSIVTVPFYIPTSKGTEDEMVGWHH